MKYILEKKYSRSVAILFSSLLLISLMNVFLLVPRHIARAQSIGDVAVTAASCLDISGKVIGAIGGLVGGAVATGLNTIIPGAGSLLSGLLGGGGGEQPVSDAEIRKKESCKDAIAFLVAKRALAVMTNSLINQINRGRNGEPQYTVNLRKELEGLGNDVFSEFIYGSELDSICSPFRGGVSGAIKLTYSYGTSREGTAACRLFGPLANVNVDIQDTIKGFFGGNLSNYGWEGWLQVTSNPSNNPFGSYLKSVSDIDAEASIRVGAYSKEIDIGNGFLGVESCVIEGSGQLKDTRSGTDLIIKPVWVDLRNPSVYKPRLWEDRNNNGEYDEGEEEDEDGNSLEKPYCFEKGVITPGSVVADQLNNALGTSINQAELADELNESLASIFDAILNRLFTSDQGLRGLSRRADAGTDPVNFLEEFGDELGTPTDKASVIKLMYGLINDVRVMRAATTGNAGDESGKISVEVYILDGVDFDFATQIPTTEFRDIPEEQLVRAFKPEVEQVTNLLTAIVGSLADWTPTCVRDKDLSNNILAEIKKYESFRQELITFLFLNDESLFLIERRLEILIDIARRSETSETLGGSRGKSGIDVVLKELSELAPKIPNENTLSLITSKKREYLVLWASIPLPEGVIPRIPLGFAGIFSSALTDYYGVNESFSTQAIITLKDILDRKKVVAEEEDTISGICQGVYPIDVELYKILFPFSSLVNVESGPSITPVGDVEGGGTEESPSINVFRYDVASKKIIWETTGFDSCELSWNSSITTTNGEVSYTPSSQGDVLDIICRGPNGSDIKDLYIGG